MTFDEDQQTNVKMFSLGFSVLISSAASTAPISNVSSSSFNLTCNLKNFKKKSLYFQEIRSTADLTSNTVQMFKVPALRLCDQKQTAKKSEPNNSIVKKKKLQIREQNRAFLYRR